MPVIELKLHVNAPAKSVYDVARDVESFPDFMEDLQSITVLERSEDGNRMITEWVGVIREFKMTIKWRQEDVWNPDRLRDDFKLVKGDMDSMSGYWEFVPDGEGSTFVSKLEYEYNVPLVGPMIKNLIRKKMEGNLDAQMRAIATKAEGRGRG
jgi:ribosome-associated toxin RatA of RatAB toxin-antitoxin module